MAKSELVKKAEWLKPYHWKKGQSGNTSGAKFNMVKEIKALTGDGIEMVHAMVRLMRGEKWPGFKYPPKYEIIHDSAKWLAEMAFGKAPIMVAGDNGSIHEIQKILYMELVKHGNEPGIFDVSEGTVLGQDLAHQQPVQDPLKNGHSEIQIKPAPNQNNGRLSGPETDPTHNPQE